MRLCQTIATPPVMPDLIGHLPTARGREWGRRADEVVGAPDAVPPLAPTMSLTPRGRRGTPQLYAHPSDGNSHQLSPFALAREPVVPATRSILRLLRLRQPHSRPLGVRAISTSVVLQPAVRLLLKRVHYLHMLPLHPL